jgi:hypothetical protein
VHTHKDILAIGDISHMQRQVLFIVQVIAVIPELEFSMLSRKADFGNSSDGGIRHVSLSYV